ncbi:MinD/ParA family ATP-binding protein [Halobellus inordinatus]|uniref:MinD/ParA family ATP-binding protein n=1 Tax=Halobellus inordinatus TaxID=1126236 RepID=UPI00210DCB4A|nr:CDP-4-keto-6-deoxy-D-glucose-3-dehydrase [Halobellus inordinatus]
MLAIAGGKGGSGKTTTTLGLARAVDGPTLAVDADCDLPNLHALAGVPRDPSPGGFGHPDPASPSSETRILPAPQDAPDGVGGRLRRLVDSDDDATVLVDCPAGAGPDATVPLRVADAVLLVATPCVAALRDAAKTAAMARAVGTPVVGGVLTRALLAPPGVDDLLGCPVLATVPPAADPLAAPPVRRAYDDLAQAVCDRPKS